MPSSDSLGWIMICLVLFISYYIYYDNIESFQLKCIVSDIDGNKYCVRERNKLELVKLVMSSHFITQFA